MVSGQNREVSGSGGLLKKKLFRNLTLAKLLYQLCLDSLNIKKNIWIAKRSTYFMVYAKVTSASVILTAAMSIH